MAKSVLEMYKALSPEQLQFANTKIIDTTMKMKKWYDYMVPIAAMDKFNDEMRKKKKNRMGWTIFGLVASLILTFVFLPFILLLILLIVILIVLISKLKALKKLDIGNHLRLFLMPFLVVMKEECQEESKAKIKIDASIPINPKKITNVIKPVNSGLPQITTTVYSHPWLEAEFELSDGTGLQLECGDTVLSKSIKKRGSSGKIKYKSKTKIKHKLELKLCFRKDAYIFNGSNPVYMYQDLDNFHMITVKHKLETLSVEQSIPLQDVLSMIAGAYQLVKPIVK